MTTESGNFPRTAFVPIGSKNGSIDVSLDVPREQFRKEFELHLHFPSTFLHRQDNGKGRSLSQLAFHLNVSLMAPNDSITHRQPQARTFIGFLGGKKRIEYMIEVLFGYTATGIRNRNLNMLVVR